MAKILVVAPHPDDADIGIGGLIFHNVRAGNTVSVLYITRGERGIPGTDPEIAALIRTEEAIEASDRLGYHIIGFLDQPDGSVSYSDELVNDIKDFIVRENPNYIFVTHEHESHNDHRVAAKLVGEANNRLDNKYDVLTYEVWTPIWKPTRFVNISGDAIVMKQAAIEQHKSQNSRQAFEEAATALNRFRGIMNGRCDYAEALGKLRLKEDPMMTITLALFTWSPSRDHPRARYAYKTLESALTNLDPGDNKLQVHICDDGSDPMHIDRLTEICDEYGYRPTFTDAKRGGYGKSYNLMMQVVHPMTDYVICLEDDWELTKPLKLEPIIRAMDTDRRIECVRLGYLGFTQELRGSLVNAADNTFLLLDPNSPEPHVFTGHPRIETVNFQKRVGAWPEGVAAGETEWQVTHRHEARVGVAWPMDLGIPASQHAGALFAHIGSVGVGEVDPVG